MNLPQTLIAFSGTDCVAKGSPSEVAEKAKRLLDAEPASQLLVFDAETSYPVELDLRGSVEDVLARLEPTATPPRGPGRPKLGVVPKEVTLLPRHWDWLSKQPGGASVTLRKLVEAASKSGQGKERTRQAQDATYRFMLALGGNLANFEEATRALYADDSERFESLTEEWPAGLREHTRRLAAGAFSADIS